MRKTVKLFKALSDKNRLRILKMLATRGLYVCEITEVLHLALSTVSKHLSILSDAGFIIDVKEGRWVRYRLKRESDDPCVQELLRMLRLSKKSSRCHCEAFFAEAIPRSELKLSRLLRWKTLAMTDFILFRQSR